jgi:NADH-quinone oxidoreductase subunit M
MGVSGSIYAMLSHGLTTGGLFLGIGVLYERRHTRRMAEYGGIWTKMPVFSGLYLIIVLGSAGLPGLSGFIGEFLTIFGTFMADGELPPGWDLGPSPRLAAVIAATGVIFGAIYLLYMFQKVFFGPLDPKKNGQLKDLDKRELAVFVPLVIAIIAMGVFPKPFLKYMDPSVQNFLGSFRSKLSEPDGPARMQGTRLDDLVDTSVAGAAGEGADR